MKFAIRDGGSIAVARPANPELAVQLATKRVGSSNPRALDHILNVCGPYTFVGLLGDDFSSLLDDAGNIIGSLQAGDSLFAAVELSQRATVVDESV